MHDGSNKMRASFLCYHFYTELELNFPHAQCPYDYPEKKATNGATFFPLRDGEFKKVNILVWMETDLLSFVL